MSTDAERVEQDLEESTNRLRAVIGLYTSRLLQALSLLEPRLALRPLHDRVLVRVLEEDTVKLGSSGLWSVQLDESRRGEGVRAMVLALGVKAAEKLPGLEVGHVVVMDYYVGQFVPHWGADAVGLDLRLLQATDCLAVLELPEAPSG